MQNVVESSTKHHEPARVQFLHRACASQSPELVARQFASSRWQTKPYGSYIPSGSLVYFPFLINLVICTTGTNWWANRTAAMVPARWSDPRTAEDARSELDLFVYLFVLANHSFIAVSIHSHLSWLLESRRCSLDESTPVQ